MVLVQKTTPAVAPYRLETTNIHATDLPAFLGKHHVLTVMALSSNASITGETPFCAVDFQQHTPIDDVEIWYTNRPVIRVAEGPLVMAHDGRTLMGVARVEDSQTRLTEDTRHIYHHIFAACERLGYPYLCRMWNFIPHINGTDAHGLERYRAFCRGRAEAFFDDAHYGERFLPAGTGVGTHGGPLSVVFLATAEQGRRNIENPKQMPAYHYPNQYGPKSPSFARATYMGKGRDHMLLVSGTSAIIGHETVHSGNVELQTLTTFNNLRYLMSHENLSRYQIEGQADLCDLDQVKVYVRHPHHVNAVRALCDNHLNPRAHVVYLGSDICRSDLLVEIEGVARLRTTAG